MHKSELGKLFVISGPSGVGKDTLMALILPKITSLNRWITVTSRKPRPGEINGINYFFKSIDEMKRMINKGELVEWNEFAGSLYGTPKEFVNNKINNGENVITCIDVNGALSVKKFKKDSCLIFIEPPSIDVLKSRLEQRNTENNKQIEDRLKIVKFELKAKDKFDYVVVNDKLEEATDQICSIISKKLNS